MAKKLILGDLQLSQCITFNITNIIWVKKRGWLNEVNGYLTDLDGQIGFPPFLYCTFFQLVNIFQGGIHSPNIHVIILRNLCLIVK